MSKVLIVAEHDGAHLNASTAKCVTCAQAIPGCGDHHRRVCSGRFSGRRAGRETAARCEGAEDRERAPTRTRWPPSSLRRSRRSRAPYSHVFGPSTTFGKDLMPRIAALLDTAQISDVMAAGERHPLPSADLCGQFDRHGRSRCGHEGRGDRAYRFVRSGGRRRYGGGRSGLGECRVADAYEVRVGVGRRSRTGRTCRRRNA